MVVLKIIGWILASLTLLLALILMLSADLLLQSDGIEGFRVKVRVLGLTFGSKPKKEKRKKEKKPESAFVRSIKEALGISHLTDAQGAREAIEKKGLGETVTETVELFMLVLDRVIWLVKRCRVPYCRITAVSGGEEAALDYGIACAVLYPLTAYLQEKMRLKPKKLKLQLACDHAREQGSFELDLAVRVRVIHAVRVLLHIVKKNLEKEVEKE
ncbi:MAG: hypothetical protein IKM48_07450 [Clostridia bacterium]|nr:hypothetical protein [Clostridia bacterium]